MYWPREPEHRGGQTRAGADNRALEYSAIMANKLPFLRDPKHVLKHNIDIHSLVPSPSSFIYSSIDCPLIFHFYRRWPLHTLSVVWIEQRVCVYINSCSWIPNEVGVRGGWYYQDAMHEPVYIEMLCENCEGETVAGCVPDKQETSWCGSTEGRALMWVFRWYLNMWWLPENFTKLWSSVGPVENDRKTATFSLESVHNSHKVYLPPETNLTARLMHALWGC